MKNIGTKKIARIVADSMPPTTARPIAFCPPAPAPVEIASGNTPKMKARLVIRIGRKRNFAASIAASNAFIPSRIRSSANSTIRIAFLRGHADRRDQPHLEVDVVVEPGQCRGEQRTDHAERHDEHHGNRHRPAFV